MARSSIERFYEICLPHQLLETLKMTEFKFGANTFGMKNAIEIEKEVEVGMHCLC